MDFSTKAETLAALKGCLKSARIIDLVYFSYQSWRVSPQKCIKDVFSKLPVDSFIVRSSSSLEDTSKESNAGAFLSVLNVTKSNLSEAIDRVFLSYGVPQEADQVLVQPMLEAVTLSGVAFSHDPSSGAYYNILNWTESTDTTAITGGQSGKTWVRAGSSKITPPIKLNGVISLLEELQCLFDGKPIDCEYAITSDAGRENIYLLQARQLVIQKNLQSKNEQAKKLSLVKKKLEKEMMPHPFLHGETTIFGVMPDWNPAEIIGIRPKPLALSLYSELITDTVWAYQRHNYGYKNLRSFPLMAHFFGLPYIDVRVSFNSFIPASLDDVLSAKLVDYYLKKLRENPYLHDKIEFEIIFSCYTFDLAQRLEELDDSGFTKAEQIAIAKSLKKLTTDLLEPANSVAQHDFAKLKTLSSRRDRILDSELPILSKVFWLAEDCKRYGTLPFAGLARVGFIAVELLQSLVNLEIFSTKDKSDFLESISTVSKDLSRDKYMLNKEEFKKKYSHLRPGSYDILSLSYGAAFEQYFDWTKKDVPPKIEKTYQPSLLQCRDIENLLYIHGIQISASEFLDFIRLGIERREYAKFEFSKNLSCILDLIGDFADENGLSLNEIAFCEYNDLMKIRKDAVADLDELNASIKAGQDRYTVAKTMILPPLIYDPDDVWQHSVFETSPNFVTQKSVTSKVSKYNIQSDLSDTIVLIPSADPGFDWIFSHSVAGLITMWGGANSHMAIRAGELGLPSVIGCGQALFEKLSAASVVSIDCLNKTIRVIN